jgi:nucleoside-diphosphate-sugar epimerase
MNVLILGINGFIGHHLTAAILTQTSWTITGLDRDTFRLESWMKDARYAKRLHVKCGDMLKESAWIDEKIQEADVVLPLVAIATPALYVKDPVRVFELDFEANLPVVRACTQHKTRLIFPSTSEVYGMCTDEAFDPYTSSMVYGPIEKPRWIYACSKQLMDRLIHGYGTSQGLDYTLFRPFNWIGTGLDTLDNPNPGSARVISQFLGHFMRGEDVHLVEGGVQKRAFTDIEDGISALMRILENKDNIAHQRIYNIGNPTNEFSIAELAYLLQEKVLGAYRAYFPLAERSKIVSTSSVEYYGAGYQDVSRRVPCIEHTRLELGWEPRLVLDESLERILRHVIATMPI